MGVFQPTGRWYPSRNQRALVELSQNCRPLPGPRRFDSGALRASWHCPQRRNERRLQVSSHPYLFLAGVRWKWLVAAGVNEARRSVQALCAHVPSGHPQLDGLRAGGLCPVEYSTDKEPADAGPAGGRVCPHGDELYSR